MWSSYWSQASCAHHPSEETRELQRAYFGRNAPAAIDIRTVRKRRNATDKHTAHEKKYYTGMQQHICDQLTALPFALCRILFIQDTDTVELAHGKSFRAACAWGSVVNFVINGPMRLSRLYTIIAYN